MSLITQYQLGAFHLKIPLHNPDFIILKSLYRDFYPVLIMPTQTPFEKVVIGYHWQFRAPKSNSELYIHEYQITQGFDNTKTFFFNPTERILKIKPQSPKTIIT